GVFRHGAMLVGTHAFGAILNALGVGLPANYYTADIDVARYDAIPLAARPERGIVELLERSGLPFVEVPELDVRKPSTSFRARGRKLRVDLLVPGDTRYRTYRIPELGAHATGLPFLDYLLADRVPAVVLGRDHVVPVRVPNAARYCLHKLIVASLRASRAAAKADKDIAQSAVLAAVLAEKFEADLHEAARKAPAGARKRLAQGAPRAAALLTGQFAAGRDFLEGLRRS
ncbi:MAG: GSU2403 family nucleotidyltransferase fold protein, partial [Longimicrobiales bacterium]